MDLQQRIYQLSEDNKVAFIALSELVSKFADYDKDADSPIAYLSIIYNNQLTGNKLENLYKYSCASNVHKLMIILRAIDFQFMWHREVLTLCKDNPVILSDKRFSELLLMILVKTDNFYDGGLLNLDDGDEKKETIRVARIKEGHKNKKRTAYENRDDDSVKTKQEKAAEAQKLLREKDKKALADKDLTPEALAKLEEKKAKNRAASKARADKKTRDTLATILLRISGESTLSEEDEATLDEYMSLKGKAKREFKKALFAKSV